MPRPFVVAALLAAPLSTLAPAAQGAATAVAAAPARTQPAAKAPPRPQPSVVRPAKLGQCVGCHGVSGRSTVAGTPHLGGQDRLYLANALRAYRSGARKAPPMNAIANTLQPRDVSALAAWYAAQPGGAR